MTLQEKLIEALEEERKAPPESWREKTGLPLEDGEAIQLRDAFIDALLAPSKDYKKKYKEYTKLLKELNKKY